MVGPVNSIQNVSISSGRGTLSNNSHSSVGPESEDSFSSQESTLRRNPSKLCQVYHAHKNTAAEVTETVTGSSGTVVKHTSTFLQHSSRLLVTASAIAPLGSFLGGALGLFKDAHTEDIGEQRLKAIQHLYTQVFEAHFSSGLPKLEPDLPLAYFHTPAHHERSTCEIILHTLGYSIEQMHKRTQSLQAQELGSGVIMIGSAIAATGVGVPIGIIVAGAGAIINLGPTARGIGRAAYKKYCETKGVDRKSSAGLIWGLVLRKFYTRDEVREIPEAIRAW